MTSQTISKEYIQLAIALDQHNPGTIDAYFGPSEWQEEAQAEEPRPLPELAQRAATLAAAITNADTLPDQRRAFLARQLLAMQTSLRLLQGETLPLAEEAELIYDVRPTWINESFFTDIHHMLHDLLPPGGALRERMAQHKQALTLTVAQAQQLIPLMHEHLRQLSRDRFPLPAAESIEFTYVQDQPWMAYNWYQGQGRSQIEINTDRPLYINDLATLVAHEAYPGHHTELAIKDSLLVQQAGYREHSLTLINAPTAVISEGIATCALDTVLSDEAWIAWHAAEIFPRAGMKHLDARRERTIERGLEQLYGVFGNAAFLLHEEGAAAETVSSYLQQYALLTEQEANHMIEFMSNPLDRAYIFTYYWGRKMLEELFTQKGERPYWYTRLLTEPVTPTQVRQWTAATDT